MPSSQAKGTNSTSFLTHIRNEVELVPLACEDAEHAFSKKNDFSDTYSRVFILTLAKLSTS